nr:hypothetical protein [Tanacetum cinerariifolium]
MSQFNQSKQHGKSESAAPQLPEQAPPSPDYVLGPEHLPSPDYVPGPEYSKYVAPSDAEIPIEDQLLPAHASPIALSLGYVADSDPKEDPEEDPADYTADGGDDDDDDGDDDDDEEEEARKTVSHHPPITTSTEALIAKYAVAPTPPVPPLSPLSPWSSPLPHIQSPPLHVLSLPLPLPSPPIHTSPTYTDAPLGYKAAMIQSRAASPPLYYDHLCCYHLLLKEMIFPRQICGFERESVSLLSLPSLTSGRVRLLLLRRAMTIVGEVNKRVTDLAITQRQEAQELYAWSRSKDRSMALEASIRTLEASIKTLEGQVRTLQTQHDRMEWQRQQACDMVTSAFGRIHVLEARDRACTRDAGPQDGPTDDDSSAQGIADALAEYEAYRSSGNGDDRHDSGCGRRTECTTRECTYNDNLKCQPLNFKDVVSYTQPFQELALMCGRMFLEEFDEVEKYVGGLPDMIQGSVMASKPKTMQHEIEFATEPMDQKIRTFADQ